MNFPGHGEGRCPADEPDDSEAYSLEITARLCGLTTEAILKFEEQGFVQSESGKYFDEEALRTLRRIEHLRQACGVNTAGLRLILHLMEELEQLRELLRTRR